MSREVYVIGDIHGDYNIIDARFGDVVGQGNKDNVLFVAELLQLIKPLVKVVPIKAAINNFFILTSS